MIQTNISRQNYQRLFFFVFFLFTIKICVFSQTVKGIVIDDQQQPLEFASVALLKPTDSVLVNFSYTNDLGSFELSNTPNGKYLLQIYLTGFAPYYKSLELMNQEINLKSIRLEPKLEQLDEITITAVVPVQIKKDTIAYNAGSFKIHHDDNIEDLLKKLPGIELDRDGNITAQGNDISKIYVDGKEFFSGDPAIVLKNLSANSINKIEVIDKKSDEAELTGINDDQKNYVINLTLKKNKKRRGFGKVAGGIGLDKKYFADLNYNRFSRKMQLSLIGKTNDINVTGSNIQDFLNYSGGLADDSESDEQVNSGIKKRDLSGQLTTRVVGINYGYEIKRKEVISVDYFYNYLDNHGTSTNKRLSFFKLNNHRSESENENASTGKNHQANFNYENKKSKEKRLFIKGSIGSNKQFTNTQRMTNYYDENEELRTTSNSQYSNNNKRDRGNIKVNYFQKLDSTKRNFGLGMSFFGNKNTHSRIQNTENTRTSSQNVNVSEMFKDERITSNTLTFLAQYTEPLSAHHFLKIQSNYIIRFGSETADQQKFQNQIEKPTLSYKIKNKEQRYGTTLSYNYNIEKFNFFIGSELLNLYRDFGNIDEDPYKTKNIYVNPRVSIRFLPKKGNNYFLNYRRIIRTPGTYQSSPVLNDINPFYLRRGNPNLIAEKIDNLGLNITFHNYRNSSSFYSKLNYQHIDNAIITSLIIDDDFVKTRSFENYGSQDRITANFNFNSRIKSLGMRYNFKTTGQYRTANSIIEFEINDVISKSYSLSASIENDKKNKIDASLGFSLEKNFTDFSVQQDLNRNYVNQKYFSRFDYDLSKKLNLNTQFEYLTYKDSNFNTNQTIPLWNGSISYAITKNKAGILKFLVIDILNKNVDIEKRSTINYFEETTNQMLGRYFIASFTYRLNGKVAKKKRKKKRQLTSV